MILKSLYQRQIETYPTLYVLISVILIGVSRLSFDTPAKISPDEIHLATVEYLYAYPWYASPIGSWNSHLAWLWYRSWDLYHIRIPAILYRLSLGLLWRLDSFCTVVTHTIKLIHVFSIKFLSCFGSNNLNNMWRYFQLSKLSVNIYCNKVSIHYFTNNITIMPSVSI